MWIRLASFKVKPDRAARLRQVYNEQAVPRVRKHPGNLACLLLQPAAEGDETYKAITIWEDRAAGEAYDVSGAAADIVKMVSDCFAGPPTLESFESHSALGLAIDSTRPG